MFRKDIEAMMKSLNLTQIDLVYTEDDMLAVYCTLKNGTLKDYTDHVVDRKKDIWGCLIWKNGMATKISFVELKNIFEAHRQRFHDLFA